MEVSVSIALPASSSGIPQDPDTMLVECADAALIVATDSKGGTVEIELVEENGVLSVAGVKMGNTYTVNEVERALVRAGKGWVDPAVMRLLVVDVKKSLTREQGGGKG